MRILLQPDCLLGLPLNSAYATDHFGMFNGLDSIFGYIFGSQEGLDE